MIKIAITAGMCALAMPAMAQETAPSTWRDPDTRCIYLKIGDTLSLRYRRDGTPDCASVQRDIADETITRSDLRELNQGLARSIDELRRDISGVRSALESIRRDLENVRREVRDSPAQ
jgi:septal ring factor EnvC (AmiA/AmiB activator)